MAGSIQDRGNGSYYLVYHIGYDAEGRRIRKTRTVKAKNMTEAKKKLASFVTEIERGEYIAPSNTKFHSFVEVWKQHAKKKLAPKTMEMYTYLLDGRLIPAFSHLNMEDITHVFINDYMANLEDEGLSTSTIQKHHNVLSNIFKLAKTHELIKKNPMDKVEKVTVRYKQGEVYSPDELKKLYVLLEKEKNRQMVLMIKLALNTGMRKGEILALQWDDLDFNTNTIHINHSLSYTKENGYQLKEPKTKGSKRNLGVSVNMMKLLKRHVFKKKTDRIQASELWEGGNYYFVFSSDTGKPIHQDVPNRWWNRFLTRTKFKKIRFHDLRHTFATNLINKGGNINKISKYLGHHSITISMDIYGHLLKEDREIADMIDEDYM